MKIAMLIEAWKPMWGGGQAHVWELSKRLVQNHNCEVDIFVMKLTNKNRERFFGGKLNIFYVGKKNKFDIFSRLRWCNEVCKIISLMHNNKKYDLIHAHANLPGLPAKFLSFKLKIPVIYTVHGCGLESIKDMYGNSIKSYFLYVVEKYLQTKIKYDCEITVDKSFLKYKNKNKRIKVVSNGVDIEKFDKIRTRKSKKFKIVFVGRLHPQKGLDYLIEGLNIVKDRLKNIEVHLIGSGNLEKKLKQKIKKLNLQNIIKFKGKIYGDDLVKEYKSSHLFVLPSLYEGQPLTLLEAWAAKLPVIVTNVGGNKDFVKNGINGYLISPKSINKLAQILLKAINNRNLKKLGENGYELVKKNYNWDRIVNETYGVYENVI